MNMRILILALILLIPASAFAHPESGFLPDASEGYLAESAMKDMKVFIGHGEKDEIVPVERARAAHQLFQDRHIPVQYCLSNVGHRLGSECFSAFTAFMEA